MIKENRPWHKYKSELAEAFECYALVKQFGWTDDYILELKENKPDRYLMYISLLKGYGMSEDKKE